MATMPMTDVQQQPQAPAPPPPGVEPTSSAPEPNAGEGSGPVVLTKEQQDALIQIRKTLKEGNVAKRLIFLRRVMRAFEVLKNNPYIVYNDTTQEFDTLDTIMQGVTDAKDIDLYQSNDNVYQMLALAFIAALSPDVPKTRYQPGDADNEADIEIAQKASTIQAYNERRNGIKALQKLELLYLWVSGSYFCYTRHIIDKNRAGIIRTPVMSMVPQQILPDRYICPNCAAVTPEDKLNPMSGLRCPDCNSSLGPTDFYEGYTAPVPTQTGVSETPGGMTAMDVYSGLNVDVDPDAKELYDSLYLDLEAETNIAWVRAQFPSLYRNIQQGEANSGSSADDTAKMARQATTVPGANGGTAITTANVGTYSRCWLQVEAFNILEDETMAKQLTGLFPNGVKLVTFSNDVFLQAVPERMMDKWTCCRTIKGLGMYPFGVGDVALDVQVRINDAANNVHAYMDRLAFGTILFDADVIDGSTMQNKTLAPGNMTGVKRTGDEVGQKTSLEDLMYQPQFHIDSHIFEYGPQLIQLAQILVGVQPQTFGGSDPNVKTMGGQEQALKTALGRMMLFWDQIREEHAARAQNSVKCSVENMDDEIKIVINGDVDGDYRTETLLASQLTGEFLAYAESDEGFPASYEEVQARIMQLLEMGQKNAFLMAVLSDPDTQKVVSRYILPDQIRLPGERERARLKMMMQQLAKSKPSLITGPGGQPVVIPSMHLNPKFDDMAMAQTIAKGWLQENWQTQATNPDGFSNVLAFLTEATQLVEEAQAAQAIQMQNQSAQPKGNQPAPAPAGA
ncbi:MAG TPA: hypothetical protein VGU67_02955 [Edaphobacter sp.]|nr:hypothetical protein [Edaphobacter sp.]